MDINGCNGLAEVGLKPFIDSVLFREASVGPLLNGRELGWSKWTILVYLRLTWLRLLLLKSLLNSGNQLCDTN